MADPDLTKLKSTTLKPAFKNNDVYVGSFTISGTMNSQSKIITKEIRLPSNSDIVEILFKGRVDSTFEARPASAWFKRGAVWVRTDDSPGYVNYSMPFYLSARIEGRTLIIQAAAFKTFIADLDITSTDVDFKIIDYSVF